MFNFFHCLLLQVDQTNSFLCQLVFIQQEQRDAMYSAYEHLKKLQLKLRWMNAGGKMFLDA